MDLGWMVDLLGGKPGQDAPEYGSEPMSGRLGRAHR